jgi:site-specific DNA-methyltransferase (adenine-specific)/modification methylase
MNRIETIGDCTLYLGDCRDILLTLPIVAAVVTDPPYGIGESAGKAKTRTSGLKAMRGSGSQIYRRDYGNDNWDDKPIDDDLIVQSAPPVAGTSSSEATTTHCPPPPAGWSGTS